MKIQKILQDSASGLQSLANRLEIQKRATRDPSDDADLKEYIEDTLALAIALTAIGEAYAPIIQQAIDVGCQGVNHKIQVLAMANASPEFELISEHFYSVELVSVQ